MGTKHHSSDPIAADPKKRRRVGFSKIDEGVEANECMKIYLVSSKEEVDSPDSFCIEPVDLNQFFEEDGKIYGYQGLKITVWISSISFHVYAEVTFNGTSDGGKGITDLKSSLQNIFAENLIETKDDFFQTFLTENHYIKSVVSSAELLQQKDYNVCTDDSNYHSKGELSDVEVFSVVGTSVGHLYSRLVPLVLLLVDGSNPIDITDSSWEIYLLVQKSLYKHEDSHIRLLGFAAVYRFHRYPESMRLRLGQILILPPYQRKGYGRRLLEVLNNVAVTENVYDLTVEEPVDSLQYVRTCIDVERLLVFEQIQDALNSVVLCLKQENLPKKSHATRFGPPLSAIEDVRRSLKINKKQFSQCWEVLIYVRLDPINKYLEAYRNIILDRLRSDVIGKDAGVARKQVIDVPTDYDQEMSFVMCKVHNGESSSIEMDENEANQEAQLQKLVDERVEEIKSIAKKVTKNTL